MHFLWFRPVLLASMVAGTAALGGCASATHKPTDPAEAENNDPYESVNRKMWAADMALDRYLLKPIAITYRDHTPQMVQTSVTNVLRNLRGPTIMLNDLLQGNPDRAVTTFARLTINTLFGLGGIMDLATKAKIPFHDSDFGQTLGVWGFGTGPYLVLPLLGPSDPRDGIGYGVDSFADVFSIKMHAHGVDEANYARLGGSIISDRAASIDQLDAVQKESLDFYAAIRSLYLQQRAAAVATAKADGTPPAPDISGDVINPGETVSKVPAHTVSGQKPN